MAIDYTQVNAGQQWVALLPSAARTSTPNQQQLDLRGDVDSLVIVVNATVVGATGNVTVLIEGVDPATQATYPILTALTTAIINNTNTAVTYSYRVAESLVAGVNATNTHSQAANDIVPPVVRVTLTHSAGTSFTYSVTALTPN